MHRPALATVAWERLHPAAAHLRIGVQLSTAPWHENRCLRVAVALEALGLCSAPVASGL